MSDNSFVDSTSFEVDIKSQNEIANADFQSALTSLTNEEVNFTFDNIDASEDAKPGGSHIQTKFNWDTALSDNNWDDFATDKVFASCEIPAKFQQIDTLRKTYTTTLDVGIHHLTSKIRFWK